MIRISHKGNFKKTDRFLMKALRVNIQDVLTKYAKRGVQALAAATPVDTGTTANSWSYTLEIAADHSSIFWTNSNIHNGINIAVILQYGHGTGTGGWVEGRDYINPAMQPVFEKIAEDAWKEVTSV